jgi:oxygen-independent coproporphyrinogen-3 oxidase
MLTAAGMPAYEVSNHARPGEECRHNLLYWTGGDYVGCGPGAHGRLSGPRGTIATRQIARPDAWLAAVEERGHGTANGTALGPEERRDELVIMGLRLAGGLDRKAFRAASGLEIEEALDRTRLERLAEQGFLVVDTRGLRATARGRRRLDAAIRTLLA